MEVELKHTWRVSRSAWYIRFYCWLWQARKQDITFCKLWWGYVFVLPGLFIRLVFTPIIYVLVVLPLNAIADHREEHPKEPYIGVSLRRVVGHKVGFYTTDFKGYHPLHWDLGTGHFNLNGDTGRTIKRVFDKPGTYQIRAKSLNNQVIITREVVIKPPSVFLMRMLEAVSQTPTKINFALDPVVNSKPGKRVRKGLKVSFKGLGWLILVGVALAGVVGLAIGIYEAADTAPVWTAWIGTATVTAVPWIGMGIAAILCTVLFALFMWCVVRPPTTQVAKKGAVSFRDAMKIGYVSVKSNTCPRVEVED